MKIFQEMGNVIASNQDVTHVLVLAFIAIIAVNAVILGFILYKMHKKRRARRRNV